MIANKEAASEIPAAIPTIESDDENDREKFLETADNQNGSADFDDADEDEIVLAKPNKKKLIPMFALFLTFFVLMITGLCWFFGLSVFASAPTRKIDRNAKSAAKTSEVVSDDQKLKNALEMVADKNPAVSPTPFVAQSGDLQSAGELADKAPTASDSFVTVPSARATDSLNELTTPVVVTDSRENKNAGDSNQTGANTASTNANSGGNSFKISNGQIQSNNVARRAADSPSQADQTPIGRSLFFGKQSKTQSERNENARAGAAPIQSTANLQNNDKALPFGTLLPVRFLGAVYTLKSSGGLVRMQLTRTVSGRNFSYPSGTILVGTLRGSEYKRAFVSVAGLIDPVSGGLVKFAGEVMGADGASGIAGRRRSVKGAWARVLNGLRDAGGATLGAIGNIRGGGTVVISDSSSKAADLLSGELSGLVRGKQSNEFVEVPAGTTAYVLVTDLPGEVSDAEGLAKNAAATDEIINGNTGLSENELVELLTEGSPEKIRAAMPRMSAEFRSLAEKALAAMQSN